MKEPSRRLRNYTQTDSRHKIRGDGIFTNGGEKKRGREEGSGTQ